MHGSDGQPVPSHQAPFKLTGKSMFLELSSHFLFYLWKARGLRGDSILGAALSARVVRFLHLSRAETPL